MIMVLEGVKDLEGQVEGFARRRHVAQSSVGDSHGKIQLRAEQRDLLVAALAKARKRGDRPLAHLLEAALLANCDLGAELDAAGQAILQLDVLWSAGGPG